MGCCRGVIVWDESGSHLGGREWTRVIARRGDLPGVRLASPELNIGGNQGTEE